MEIWKDIEGYEGYYQVSTMGRVRSLDRYVLKCGHNYLLKGRIKTLSTRYDGYIQVKLHKGKKQETITVHILVARAFIPNPNNYKYCNHRDENPANNCVENIEWCDASYNTNYGTRNARSGKKLSKTVYQYDGNELVGIWQSTKIAGRFLGISPGNISDCARGVYNTAGGFTWSYVSHINNNQNAA